MNSIDELYDEYTGISNGIIPIRGTDTVWTKKIRKKRPIKKEKFGQIVRGVEIYLASYDGPIKKDTIMTHGIPRQAVGMGPIEFWLLKTIIFWIIEKILQRMLN